MNDTLSKNHTVFLVSCVGVVETINDTSLICGKLSKGMCQSSSTDVFVVVNTNVKRGSEERLRGQGSLHESSIKTPLPAT